MIIQLSDINAKQSSLTGGKGSQLATLIQSELPVPSGFVVNTEVFDKFCQSHNLLEQLNELLVDVGVGGGVRGCVGSIDESIFYRRIDAFQAKIRQLSLPTRLLQELETQLKQHPSSSLWAVRSSAVAEDMKGASFAGQYDTVLGVSGLTEISQAIRHCWASFFNANAIQYKRDRNITDNRAAVVIQQLIDADSAGVCFSMNPLNGDNNEIVINANVGLGESVVSGVATPDTFIINKSNDAILSSEIGSKKRKTVRLPGGSKDVEASPEEQAIPCLTEEQVKMVASLAKKVETFDGHCVDIEWAIADNNVYLLQSRPITSTLTAPQSTPPDNWVPKFNTSIDPKYPLYTNGNISEILPGCITPLTWSRVAPTIDYSFTKQLYEMGVINKKPNPLKELQSLGLFYYRPYIRISYFTETAIATPGLSPDLYLEEFIGPPKTKTPGFTTKDLHPRHIYHFMKICALGLANLLNNKKRVLWAEGYINNLLQKSCDSKIQSKDNRSLIDSVAFNETYGELSVIHIWVSTFASVGFGIIRNLTGKWFDDENGTLAASLITGIGVLPSAEPSFDIYNLAQTILSNDKLASIFENKNDNETYQSLLLSTLPVAQSFIGELHKFLAKHGHRGIGENELMSKCWRDEPSQVIGMIRNFLLPDAPSPVKIQKQQQKASIDNLQYCLGQLNVMKRSLFKPLLNFVRHFVEKREILKNYITLREDIARRTFQELARRLVASGDLNDTQDIYFLTWEEIRNLIYGKVSAGQSQVILTLRQQEFEWSKQLRMPKIIKGEAKPVTIDVSNNNKHLTGMGVYPGQIEGKARVVMDPRIANKVEPGEILIAPVTDAGWTPLFINAAALVVEVGGLLSHGSVVAREYGLPTVVGAEGATSMIKTGDRVAVDGKTGMVALLD
jgi:phosphohistidine swiveling domain-containing protein